MLFSYSLLNNETMRYILLTIVSYLIWVFIMIEFNPLKWGTAERLGLVMLIIFSNGLVYLKELAKNNKL